EGQPVTINYDPMISKLCTYGKDREQAIQRMIRALSEYEIAGCRTTIPFCDYVMKHDTFRNGEYDTHFVQNYFKPENLDEISGINEDYQRLAAILLKEKGGNEEESPQAVSQNGVSYNSDWWINRR
ncbi:MAG TPA: hypothetical protein VJ905_02505, partial [Halalkalibaculum sp.]|nr:hypothetical protein [Halalkalibaculum sp.]